MNNVVTLHTDKRWKAVLDYNSNGGPIVIEHYLEELEDLQEIVDRGPDWNSLVKCTITLNRNDGGESHERMQRAEHHERG